MQYDPKQNLAFLLSMAALPIAGCVVGSGDDDDGDSGTGTASAGTTGSASADDGSTSGVESSSSVTADGTGSESIGDTGTTGTADGTGTTGGETPVVCTEVGAHYEKCMLKDPEGIVTECVYYTTDPEYTAECVAANEEYYACLAMADCKDLVGGENPCSQDAIMEACFGGETTGGEEGTSTGG